MKLSKLDGWPGKKDLNLNQGYYQAKRNQIHNDTLTAADLEVELDVGVIEKIIKELMYKQFCAVIKTIEEKGFMNTDWEDIDKNGGSIEPITIAQAIAQAFEDGKIMVVRK